MPRRNQVERCKDVNTLDEHYQAMLWCHRRGIKIYPTFIKHKLHIEIYNPLIKNRLTVSQNDYTNCQAQQIIWDLYIKLCNKYKK